MISDFKKIHSDFRLNGHFYSGEALKEVAYSLIKEGYPFEKAIGDFLLDWLNDKEYVRVKTSGSTGVPKFIYLRKQHMVNSARATGEFFSLNKGDKALHCLPAKYIAGKMMLVRAMVLGLDMDLVAPTLNPLDGVAKKYDFAAMIPLQVKNTLNRLALIKKLIVGGAPVSNRLAEELQPLPTYVFETYGMTETVSHIAVRQLNKFKSTKSQKQSHFIALPGVSLETDSEGKLIIKAPHVCEETVYTNDLVDLISKTNFTWLGRADNVINSGGVKLVPEEIEKKLAQLIKKRFIVSSVKDEVLGQKPVLLVESTNVNAVALLDTIKNSGLLEKYQIPKEIYFLPSFLETETGKIQRKNTTEACLTDRL